MSPHYPSMQTGLDGEGEERVFGPISSPAPAWV